MKPAEIRAMDDEKLHQCATCSPNGAVSVFKRRLAKLTATARLARSASDIARIRRFSNRARDRSRIGDTFAGSRVE